MTDRIPPEERAQKVFDDWVATEGASWEELVAMIAKAIAEAEAEAAAERDAALAKVDRLIGALGRTAWGDSESRDEIS